MLASSNWTTDNITFNLVIGLILAVLQAGFTYLVVDRIVARNEERRRRATSAFVEARLVDAVDNLLAAGLPISSRQTEIRALTVGPLAIELQVKSVQRDQIVAQLDADCPFAVETLRSAMPRNGRILRDSSHFAVLEPRLTVHLARLVAALDRCEELCDEWQRRPTAACKADLVREVPDLAEAAWALEQAVLQRWA